MKQQMITDHTYVLHEARHFFWQCYHELGKEEQLASRWAEVEKEIKRWGYYEHTYEELSYGAKVAWRNSNRCIGRLFWKTLHVHDARQLTTAEEIFQALVDHIAFATNQGKIRPTITVFKPFQHGQQQVRIWNHQLIRYAGYETEQGVIGDPASLAFTRICQQLGWLGKGTPFDVLPLVLQIKSESPRLYSWPEEVILEVPLEHPEFPWFSELGLKWYAVPIIADMRLEIGGIHYTAAPFNGWYMETEIGARNLADTFRYNLLPLIARKMGLDTSRNTTLWKDKALVELNVAVLHSYKQAGVTIVDHHSAAEQFKWFEHQEHTCGRQMTGDWTWLIPPVSPATTHIFHQEYNNDIKKPNYFYQEKPY